jgi:hypothetical protein
LYHNRYQLLRSFSHMNIPHIDASILVDGGGVAPGG